MHPFDPTATTVGCPMDASNSWLFSWFTTFGSPTGSRPLVVQQVRNRWQIGSDPDSGAGSPTGSHTPRDLIQKEPGQVGKPNSDPSPSPDPVLSPRLAWLRHRPAAASGGARAHARTYVHSSLLFARENSKYPKGTPFVLNFLYLYVTSFHPTANVGLNACS